MSRFKVGDRVRIAPGNCAAFSDEYPLSGGEATIMELSGSTPYFRLDNGRECFGHEDVMTLVTNGDNTVKERRTFKLIKATPTHAVGTLFKEDCADGTQPYSTFQLEGTSNYLSISDRSKVEEQPSWFVEVFKVNPEYMTREELDQWETFKAPAKKRSYTKRVEAVATPTEVKAPARAVNRKYVSTHRLAVGRYVFIPVSTEKDRRRLESHLWYWGKKLNQKYSVHRSSDTHVRVMRVA